MLLLFLALKLALTGALLGVLRQLEIIELIGLTLLFSGPCLAANWPVPHPQKGCPAGPGPVGARVA